ncbi:MAG: N-acetylmuramoyl-L-alanine amidase [Parcubacteria group bacterium]|jgi:N-acetylmuramoyl-L-alanine amidase
MRNYIRPAAIFLVALLFLFSIFAKYKTKADFGLPGSAENSEEKPQSTLAEASRPASDIRIGLQAGHWKNGELPDELANLRQYGGGTSGGGKSEWEVNLAIAQNAAKILRDNGYTVDVLPATVPADYQADLFVAIHADGNADSSVSGFKVASPWNDPTGKGAELANDLEKIYGGATKLKVDPNVTRDMRGYYAFNYRRFEHSISPNTPAAIIETGFLTDPSDREIIADQPEKAASGIARAVETYLKSA